MNDQAGRRCPYCRGDVPAGAVKCQHCGEWLQGGRPAFTAGGLKRAAINIAAIAVIVWAIWAVISNAR